MCVECVEAFDELWPELSEEDRMEFLWSCTAYPVGNNTRERLEHYLAACGKNLGAILVLSDSEFKEALPGDPLVEYTASSEEAFEGRSRCS